eukprot:TRINITY_DN94915_c0_g1_i1.p1 TRINITY_DN94915_c0_g1~~TRINITY_DN94915_c0_g1_i1.p1  ORF type:complete len:295 (-),score=37.62 TRINITY_DN94915_c0_g1_i1:210-1058(-)
MTTTDTVHIDRWNRYKGFKALTPPLIPCEEDRDEMQRAIGVVQQKNPHLQALMLGVTPGVAKLDYGENSTLLAVDISEGMIERDWIGDVEGKRSVQQGNWLELSKSKANMSKFDIVLGDGSFSVLVTVEQWRALLATVVTVLKPGGQLVIRLFAPLSEQEEPQDVKKDIEDGKIGNFGIAKFRLGMAFRNKETNIMQLQTVYDYVVQQWPDLSLLIKDKEGWSEGDISTIKNWNGQNSVLTFLTQSEFIQMAEEAGLTLNNAYTPKYEFGDCCPILTLTKKE